MNLLQLRTAVRSRIAEPSARSLKDSEINGYLNDGYQDFVQYVQPCKMEKAYTIPTISKATFDIPTNCLFGIERINWTEQYPLQHCSEAEFRMKSLWGQSNNNSRPGMYTQFPAGGTGAQFQIYPKPSAASVTVSLLTSINSTDTTIHASTIPTGDNGMTAGSFPKQGFFIIDDEQIRYWDIDTVSNNFLYCERGSGYTTAASHFASGYGPPKLITYAPIQVLYRFSPPALTSDSDPILFSSVAWQEAIVCYAAANCFWQRGEMAPGNKMMETYARVRDEGKLVRERESLDRPVAFMSEDPSEFMSNWW